MSHCGMLMSPVIISRFWGGVGLAQHVLKQWDAQAQENYYPLILFSGGGCRIRDITTS